MKILDLVLKGQWYDMIASGEKREEYREIKPYWFKRLIDYDAETYDNDDPIPTYFIEDGIFASIVQGIRWDLEICGVLTFKDFTHVCLHRGYTNTTMLFKIELSIGTGRPEWGAEPGKEYFVIKLINE